MESEAVHTLTDDQISVVNLSEHEIAQPADPNDGADGDTDKNDSGSSDN